MPIHILVVAFLRKNLSMSSHLFLGVKKGPKELRRDQKVLNRTLLFCISKYGRAVDAMYVLNRQKIRLCFDRCMDVSGGLPNLTVSLIFQKEKK
jgi:hypothetical protein